MWNDPNSDRREDSEAMSYKLLVDVSEPLSLSRISYVDSHAVNVTNVAKDVSPCLVF